MDPDLLRDRLSGAMTALVTPFREGEVDHAAFGELVEWQIEQGIDALVPCGTTGEASSFCGNERKAVIGHCIEVAAGRVPIIAGTGTNDTQATIDFTAGAQALGADAALIVTPYYNRPGPEGVFRHFEAIARAVDIPIILYNVPSRTGVDLTLDTLERLAEIPNIIGLKDATGDLSRPPALSSRLGERFIQLSGHDATAMAFNLMDGRGTISVVANIAPRLCAELNAACRCEDVPAARAIQARLQPLIAALERETNPGPVKHALHVLRGLPPGLRLPLVPVARATAEAIEVALSGIHL
ncbi:MAG TPA: 4-hydroxy-tetrahydrodipicolinate synthase [Ancylobacter sp.]